jgi:rare lipoprotein A
MNRFLLTFCIAILAFSTYVNGQSKSSTSMSGAKITRQREATDNGDSATVYYGVASYYADKFNGRETASGEVYSHSKSTAACNVLPLGTWIRVTNLRNGKSIILKINDRLHAKNNRVVDLAKSAAQKLGYTGRGLARVKVEALGKKKPKD